jgi:hypothetical protein
VVGEVHGQRVVFDDAGGVSHTSFRGNDRLRVFVDELGTCEEIVRRLPPNTPPPP